MTIIATISSTMTTACGPRDATSAVLSDSAGSNASRSEASARQFAVQKHP